MGINSGLDWLKLLRIDSSWLDNLLIEHPEAKDNRHIRARAYTITFDDRIENLDGLADFMVERIKEYVLTPTEIASMQKKGKDAWREAAAYFGNRKPNSEGKYGELLLFLIVEAVLKTPMIAHKIKSISNMNAQVNGADGIFLGEIDGANTILLGESKMIGRQSKAISQALESISVFHDPFTRGAAIKTELRVASRNRIDVISREQLEYLLAVCDKDSKEYNSLKKIYPILIVYNDSRIVRIQNNCKDKVDGEAMAATFFKEASQELLKAVKQEISTKRKVLELADLEFFFIPVSSVNKLRLLLYNKIHLLS
ncbi:MAG: HamA C-terminal domain-containing protein [Candidatus Bathyarchaeia archaeon]|jgi:hypothetical protein